MTGEKTCRVCTCTDDQACVTEYGTCWWVNDPAGEGPLCSECLPAVMVDLSEGRVDRARIGATRDPDAPSSR